MISKFTLAYQPSPSESCGILYCRSQENSLLQSPPTGIFPKRTRWNSTTLCFSPPTSELIQKNTIVDGIKSHRMVRWGKDERSTPILLLPEISIPYPGLNLTKSMCFRHTQFSSACGWCYIKSILNLKLFLCKEYLLVSNEAKISNFSFKWYLQKHAYECFCACLSVCLCVLARACIFFFKLLT